MLTQQTRAIDGALTATGFAPTLSADQLLVHLFEHLIEYDVQVEQQDRYAEAFLGDAQVGLRASKTGLTVRIVAPAQSLLHYMRD
ncbi:MAG: hypothetical protein AAFV54_05535, partial [Pseudomonadota bacterium]